MDNYIHLLFQYISYFVKELCAWEEAKLLSLQKYCTVYYASEMNSRNREMKETDLSLWNFRLCTTCGIFCRKFHRCKVSSAVAETNAPSLIKNCNCITAVHPSCFTCASTPGRPKLFFSTVFIKENQKYPLYNPNSVHTQFNQNYGRVVLPNLSSLIAIVQVSA